MDTIKREMDRSFFGFLRKNKLIIGFIIFIILLCYSYKLTNINYSIDTEVFINNSIKFRRDWTSLGRYFLYFLSIPFRFSTDINPQFLNIIAYTLLAISNIFLLYILFLCRIKTKLSYFVFSGFYLSSPIVIEQTNFILQAPEVLLSVVAILGSCYFMIKYINTGKIKYPFFSILINVFSFATYSSIFIMFIILAIIINELIHFHSPYEGFKDYFFSYLLWIIVFGISYIWNYIFTLLSKYYLGDLDDSYLSSRLGLLNMQPIDYVRMIENNFFNDVLNIHSKYFIWLLPVFFVTSLLMMISKKERPLKDKLFSCLNMSFLFLFSLSGFFIVGQIYPIRSLFPHLPITIAFFAMYCTFLLKNQSVKKIITIPFFILIAAQIKVTSDFCYSAEMVARDEYQLTQKIFNRLDDSVIKNINQYKLIVNGAFSGRNPGIIKGDAIEYSFYEWDNSLSIGSSGRVAGYWKSLGYSIQSPTEKEYKKIIAHYLDSSELVKVESNFIIVNLNTIN